MSVQHEDAQYPRPPGKEILWEVITCDKNKRFIITSNENRTKYYLYQVLDNGSLSKRKAHAKNPVDLQCIVL